MTDESKLMGFKFAIRDAFIVYHEWVGNVQQRPDSGVW